MGNGSVWLLGDDESFCSECHSVVAFDTHTKRKREHGSYFDSRFSDKGCPGAHGRRQEMPDNPIDPWESK